MTLYINIYKIFLLFLTCFRLPNTASNQPDDFSSRSKIIQLKSPIKSQTDSSHIKENLTINVIKNENSQINQSKGTGSHSQKRLNPSSIDIINRKREAIAQDIEISPKTSHFEEQTEKAVVSNADFDTNNVLMLDDGTYKIHSSD